MNVHYIQQILKFDPRLTFDPISMRSQVLPRIQFENMDQMWKICQSHIWQKSSKAQIAMVQIMYSYIPIKNNKIHGFSLISFDLSHEQNSELSHFQ